MRQIFQSTLHRIARSVRDKNALATWDETPKGNHEAAARMSRRRREDA
jgi:hypothetical protein